MLVEVLWALVLGVRLVESCPAGHQWQKVNGAPFFEACPANAYSLQGWGRCCTRAQADACKGQAMGQDCTCSPMLCPDGQEPQHGPPGRFVCRATPSACTERCGGMMFRESHTCNCLRLHPQTVVWGNEGGDYFELP